MKPNPVELKVVTSSLYEQCPFILFAIVSGIDAEGRVNLPDHVELSVMLERNTGFCFALEKILPVLSERITGVQCEVVFLNRVDAVTRFNASNSRCLFIRSGQEQIYRRFIQQARLDYNILRAQFRLNGMIRND
ncbi:MAG: hypothetical protein ACOYNU_04710 [Bacteroidales bacterium]